MTSAIFLPPIEPWRFVPPCCLFLLIFFGVGRRPCWNTYNIERPSARPGSLQSVTIPMEGGNLVVVTGRWYVCFHRCVSSF